MDEAIIKFIVGEFDDLKSYIKDCVKLEPKETDEKGKGLFVFLGEMEGNIIRKLTEQRGKTKQSKAKRGGVYT